MSCVDYGHPLEADTNFCEKVSRMKRTLQMVSALWDHLDSKYVVYPPPPLPFGGSKGLSQGSPPQGVGRGVRELGSNAPPPQTALHGKRIFPLALRVEPVPLLFGVVGGGALCNDLPVVCCGL